MTPAARRAALLATLSTEPGRWWLTRELGERIGCSVSADVSASLGDLRRRGVVRSEPVRFRLLRWRWNEGA